MFWFAGVIAVLAACSVLSQARSEPVVSVWYRGTPAGTPNQDDLAMLRALGFRAVTWPASQTAGVAELKRQAAIVSLVVEVRDPLPAVTAASARTPGSHIDVRLPSLPLALLPATVWRAVAHGARSIAFDAGAAAGAGVEDVNGQTPAWIGPARTVARQLTANAPLFDQLGDGAPVKFQSIGGIPGALDAMLFQTIRDWVIIATNTSAERAEAMADLPRALPYAPWGSLLDGRVVAMRENPAGPIWNLALEPGGARIYVAAKKPIKNIP